MKCFTLIFVLLAATAFGQSVSDTAKTENPVLSQGAGCLVVKHKGTVGRRLMWTALIGVPIAPGTKYDYVDSVNYKSEKMAYNAKDLQAVKQAGVKVVLLENKYKPDDLESARKSCREEKSVTAEVGVKEKPVL